jgi:acyl-CoA thioesterase
MADPLDHNQAEPHDISHALDIEQLDLNLYRSRNLILPFQARGVFGGQVISQALVAATQCVKPEFTLHVRVHSFICHIITDVYILPRIYNGQSLHVCILLMSIRCRQ